jgi:hypothetical protein
VNITNSQLNALSIEELSRLNRMVVSTIKMKQADNNRTAIYSFRTGDQVKFSSPKSGVSYTGEVLQVKRTKVVVKTPMGSYLVPASMLNKCA